MDPLEEKDVYLLDSGSQLLQFILSRCGSDGKYKEFTGELGRIMNAGCAAFRGCGGGSSWSPHQTTPRCLSITRFQAGQNLSADTMEAFLGL